MLGEFFIGFFAGKSPLHGAFLPIPSIRPRIRLALQTFAARLLPSTVVFHRYCGPWPGCPARAHAQLGRRVTVSFHHTSDTFRPGTLQSMIEIQAHWTEEDLHQLGLLSSALTHPQFQLTAKLGNFLQSC